MARSRGAGRLARGPGARGAPERVALSDEGRTQRILLSNLSPPNGAPPARLCSPPVHRIPPGASLRLATRQTFHLSQSRTCSPTLVRESARRFASSCRKPTTHLRDPPDSAHPAGAASAPARAHKANRRPCPCAWRARAPRRRPGAAARPPYLWRRRRRCCAGRAAAAAPPPPPHQAQELLLLLDRVCSVPRAPCRPRRSGPRLRAPSPRTTAARCGGARSSSSSSSSSSGQSGSSSGRRHRTTNRSSIRRSICARTRSRKGATPRRRPSTPPAGPCATARRLRAARSPRAPLQGRRRRLGVAAAAASAAAARLPPALLPPPPPPPRSPPARAPRPAAPLPPPPPPHPAAPPRRPLAAERGLAAGGPRPPRPPPRPLAGARWRLCPARARAAPRRPRASPTSPATRAT